MKSIKLFRGIDLSFSEVQTCLLDGTPSSDYELSVDGLIDEDNDIAIFFELFNGEKNIIFSIDNEIDCNVSDFTFDYSLYSKDVISLEQSNPLTFSFSVCGVPLPTLCQIIGKKIKSKDFSYYLKLKEPSDQNEH